MGRDSTVICAASPLESDRWISLSKSWQSRPFGVQEHSESRPLQSPHHSRLHQEFCLTFTQRHEVICMTDRGES